MEDPTQLLSGSVASYVLGQLALGKKPADVAVPGADRSGLSALARRGLVTAGAASPGYAARVERARQRSEEVASAQRTVHADQHPL